MIVFLYILAAVFSYIPTAIYYKIEDDRLKWFSKIFCDNIEIFIFSFIVYLLTKYHRRFIIRKFSLLGFEFWIARIIVSNIDCTQMYFTHKSMMEEMIILNFIPLLHIFYRAIYILLKYYIKLKNKKV
jgi:hypothetical protein